jgi:hypothetical protein
LAAEELGSGGEPDQFAANPRSSLVAITRGLDSDEEKVAALLHWVAQNIRYFGLTMGKGEGYTLHPGTMTFRDRAGVCKDIAGMLVTMLRAAGYEAYGAMTMAGARVEEIPADQFNHCVVALKKPDGAWGCWTPPGSPRPAERSSPRASSIVIGALGRGTGGDPPAPERQAHPQGPRRDRCRRHPARSPGIARRGEEPACGYHRPTPRRIEPICATGWSRARRTRHRKAGDPVDFKRAMCRAEHVVPGFATVGRTAELAVSRRQLALADRRHGAHRRDAQPDGPSSQTPSSGWAQV